MSSDTRLTDNYRLLMGKLDDFIRKFYVNQLIRGVLYSIGLLLLLFIGLNVLEYYFYFGTSVRQTMFWSFVSVSVLSLGRWIGLPLVKFFRLGSVISHSQAATIIGDHFGDVKDRLLNVLQLRQMADISTSNRDLVMAAINQKSESFRLVPFQKAIDLTDNKRYLRYALPPLLLLLLLLAIAPAILRDGTYRILNNNKIFQRPAPFAFNFLDKNLRVVQYSDFTLKVQTSGKVRPNEIFVDLNGFQYRMTPETDGSFSYKFINVQEDQPFVVFAGPVRSDKYNLDVIKKPVISQFDLKLDYPDYLGRPDEALSNIGDLVVPIGTQISWVFEAEYTDNLLVGFGNSLPKAITGSGGRFSMSKKAVADEIYRVFLSNADLPQGDSIVYSLRVTPDLFPSIHIEKFVDSTQADLVFFAGDASDDYSLKQVTFNYRIKHKSGAEDAPKSFPIPNSSGKATQFQYRWDIAQLSMQPGDEITYYFEAWDNDGVNGSKSTKSNLMTFALPTEEQIEKQEKKNNDDIKKELEKAITETKRIQEEMKKMREKLLQQQEPDWQTRKEFEKLMERQQELDKKMEKAKEQFQENMQLQQQFDPADERIQEKQELVEKLFEELQNEEMKKLMEEIQAMLEKLNKDEALENMEEMQLDNEEMEQELDRMLELFKKLEVETGLEEQLEKLEELAEKQEKLGDDSEKGEKTAEQLQEEQKKMDEEFDQIQEELKDLKEKNEELEQPMELDEEKQTQEEIDKDQEDANEQLEKNEKSKAGKSQKGAGKKMKKMAGKMKSAMASGEAEQQEEDIAAMRQLLDNLVTLSYDQEKLMGQVAQTNENMPQYVKLAQQQHKLQDDFSIIQDSLQALAKRVYQIESFVTEKVTDIQASMGNSIDELEERRRPQAREAQQRTMKTVNDLALLLSETMDQMQQQASGMPGGSKSCPKPGDKPGDGKKGDKPGDKMSEGQKSVNEDMKKMAQRMKNGGNIPSKEFAQMAARQAAMREAMRKKQKELQQRGKGDPGMQQILDQMDKVEIDLVNKNLNNETLNRQEDILTRLLESERAERERGLDEKREAEQARSTERTTPPPALQEYIKKRQAEIDLFKTVSPALAPYYKQLVEEYYRTTGGK
jgi:hypothetical protein